MMPAVINHILGPSGAVFELKDAREYAKEEDNKT